MATKPDSREAGGSAGHELPALPPTIAILVISALALFLEMLLIRWIGTEIRIFAYLQNTILVVCILGLGIGCFTCRQPIALRQTLMPIAFLVLLLAIPFTRRGLADVAQALSLLSDLVIWARAITLKPSVTVTVVALGLATVYMLLVLVVDAFVPLGRILGRLVNLHPDPIQAYSANIAGSLLGTWLFVGLSALYQPPVVWFLVIACLALPFALQPRRGRGVTLALLTALIPLSWFAEQVPGAMRVVWSPYQKLTLRAPDRDAGEIGDYVITVNNTGYQMMADLSAARSRPAGEEYPAEFRGLSQYDLPLLLHPNPKRYLVVGAGGGNDVAGGLRHGASEIVGVEIDPAIIALGRAFHPEHPYASSAVHIVNDDARSYFATTAARFDVITFGLLDSHTTTAMTNARLDSYVYTRESLVRAKGLLADGGIIVLSFEAQKPFIADRMAGALQDVFGVPPLTFRVPPSSDGWGGVIFVAGDLSAVKDQMAKNADLGAFVATMQREYPVALTGDTRITTDDWPYTYLQTARIPTLYYLLAGLMVLIWFRSTRRWKAADISRRWTRTHWHFFFLGAAFLLLEVQNISKASIALGNTWQVNAVIVSGVLVMALVANWLARRFPTLRVGVVYTVLVSSCVGLYFVDLASFNSLPYVTRALVVGGLATCPVLFSGLIFVKSFAMTENRDEALGANLGGAIVGALLQSLTFIVGIRALLLVVAAFYVCSLLALPNRRGVAIAMRA